MRSRNFVSPVTLRIMLVLTLALAACGPRANFAAVDFSRERFVTGIAVSSRDGREAMKIAAESGATSIRADVPWREVEFAPGEYRIPSWVQSTVDQALANGIRPLLILAYGHPRYGNDKPRDPISIEAFTKYAEFVVRHFQGKVLIYDLWNEWDTHTGKTTPTGPYEYITLARSVYPRIKRIDPNIKILSGGISDSGLREGWLDGFLAGGGMNFIDGISIHPYNWNNNRSRTPEGAYSLIEYVLARAREHGLRPPDIYVTEIGWPTFEGRFGISLTRQANYIKRFMLLCYSNSSVKGVWWYGLRDQGDNKGNKEHNFGLLDSKLAPKPSLAALREISETIAKSPRPTLSKKDTSYQAHFGDERRVLSWKELKPPEYAAEVTAQERQNQTSDDEQPRVR